LVVATGVAERVDPSAGDALVGRPDFEVGGAVDVGVEGEDLVGAAFRGAFVDSGTGEAVGTGGGDGPGRRQGASRPWCGK